MKKLLKQICSFALISTMAIGLSACTNSTQQSSTPATSTNTDNYKIGILQLVEHDALDAARNGFIDALEQGGYIEGQNVTFDIQNAQNDQSNLKTISQKFVNEKDDLILAIATPSAQSVAAETKDIPIIATAITDYPEAALVETNEAPNTNVSGTSDKTPVDKQFELLLQILPDIKTVGIMYNSSEVNSEIQAAYAKEAAESLNLNYEMGTVTNINDIQQTVQSLSGKVDALYIPTDNTFASAMPLVCSVSDELKIPVIVGESGMCKGGGLATVGIDYYKLGQQTGKMAIKVLEGEDISKMPIEFPADADITINLDAAATLGITIPEDIMANAKNIIENGEFTVAK